MMSRANSFEKVVIYPSTNAKEVIKIPSQVPNSNPKDVVKDPLRSMPKIDSCLRLLDEKMILFAILKVRLERIKGYDEKNVKSFLWIICC